MINIDKYRNFLLFVANKNGKGAYESPSQFNLNAERSVMEYTMKRYSNPHDYQPGVPVPRMAYELTQKMIDDLRHLKESRSFTVTNDKIQIPDGSTVYDLTGELSPKYLHLSTLSYKKITQKDGEITSIPKGFKLLKDDEVTTAINSGIAPPDKDNPMANIQAKDINIYPSGIQIVDMVYLRLPNAPVWGNVITNGRPVYDASTSVDVDAPDEAMNEIVMMHLGYLGIHIREAELIQYAELNKQQGV